MGPDAAIPVDPPGDQPPAPVVKAGDGADPDGNGGGSTAPDKPEFHAGFAVVAGIVAVAVGAWVTLAGHLFDSKFGLADDSWNLLKGSGQLGARLMSPVMPLGVVLILVGAWMAVVEWRGRFGPAPAEVVAEGAADDVATVVAAVGKLQGAALLIVSGALLLFASAWVAQSAVKPGPAATPSTPASSGSVTPSR